MNANWNFNLNKLSMKNVWMFFLSAWQVPEEIISREEWHNLVAKYIFSLSLSQTHFTEVHGNVIPLFFFLLSTDELCSCLPCDPPLTLTPLHFRLACSLGLSWLDIIYAILTDRSWTLFLIGDLIKRCHLFLLTCGVFFPYHCFIALCLF